MHPMNWSVTGATDILLPVSPKPRHQVSRYCDSCRPSNRRNMTTSGETLLLFEDFHWMGYFKEGQSQQPRNIDCCPSTCSMPMSERNCEARPATAEVAQALKRRTAIRPSAFSNQRRRFGCYPHCCSMTNNLQQLGPKILNSQTTVVSIIIARGPMQ